MNKQKILITGAKGMLGQMLAEVLSGYELVLTDREEMDITDAESVRDFIIKAKSDFVIHAAAYTAVDKAEDEPANCRLINVTGTANVAQAADKIGATMFYISTDYVFDGQKKSPYTEADLPRPLSVYGQSKLDGEQAARKFCQRHYILRTAWLFGEIPHRQSANFVEKMLSLAKEKKTLRVVADQIGSPTYTRDLAQAIACFIKQKPPAAYGIYHFSGKNKVSWHDFAKEIFRQTKTQVELQPIKTADFAAKAARPAHSYMSKEKVEKALKIQVRRWQEMLADYLRRR